MSDVLGKPATTSWSLEWSHGQTTVHAGAAAIGKTFFRLGDGRWADPFHEAPWIARGERVEPPCLNHLRGEWACLPFGRPYDASDGLCEPWSSLAQRPLTAAASPLVSSDLLLHGFGAGADWTLVSHDDHALTVAIDLPEDSPISRLTRSVRPVDGSAAMDVSVDISARRSCIRPFGFHPNFALRGPLHSVRLKPRPYRFGLTHPAKSSIARAKPNARFSDLGEVPLEAGSTGRFDRLPFVTDSEDILQLCGIEDGIRLIDDDARVVWTLTWDTLQLPSCLLWISNRGRHHPPWSGENLCVGVEPVASAFDLGPAIASSGNPIAQAGVETALRLEAGKTRRLEYRIEATAFL